MKGTNLGELEELVLLIVANLNEEAYGLNIKNYIKENCGRSVSISTVHSTIHRLENKGFLKSRYDKQNSAVRGGRPKLLFFVTNAGRSAIQAVKQQRDCLLYTSDAADD